MEGKGDPRKRYQTLRLRAYWYIGTLAGCRPPHEITSLRWRDIEDFQYGKFNTVKLQIETSKTGRRPVVAKPVLRIHLDVFRRLSPWRGDDDWIFADYETSERVKNLGAAFNNLIEEAGATHNRGFKLTQYSMRHSFITWRLIAGASPWEIATNCGTSEKVIDRYYSDVVSTDVAHGILNGRK